MGASTDSLPEAARKADPKPRPFQFRLGTLMRAMAAIAAFCFLLRLAVGRPSDEKFVIGCFAYCVLTSWIVSLGKSMAATGDIRRGNRLIMAGEWVLLAPFVALILFVAGIFLMVLLWSLAGWLGFRS